MEPFNPRASCYCIALKHCAAEKIKVGALGVVDWPAGWLYYVGRAKTGWGRRLKRFAGEPPTSFWHIDYLVKSSQAELKAILPVSKPGSFECDLAGLFDREIFEPVKIGFGASDCDRGCPAHAFRSQKPPGRVFELLSERLNTPGWIEIDPAACRWRDLKE
jgi:Uri superfamily endonuclease